MSNTDPTRRERSDFWPAEQVIARGYAIAAIQVSDLAPDDKERYRDGVIRLFEDDAGARPDTAWAALAAWAWGASRAMDYFETDSGVDAKRVAVVGHSRGGKAALWAGAEDERFALVVANESGEGGAALTRRHFGETLARITDVFPHWFAGKYQSFSGRVDALPIDQHMLLALMAPRAVYVASADEDLWSDPRGEFLSLVHASPVFALWGDRSLAAGDMPPLNRPLVSNAARVSRAQRRPQPHALRLAVFHGLLGHALEVAPGRRRAPLADVQAARLPADTSNDHDPRKRRAAGPRFGRPDQSHDRDREPVSGGSPSWVAGLPPGSRCWPDVVGAVRHRRGRDDRRSALGPRPLDR